MVFKNGISMTELSCRLIAFSRAEAPPAIRYFPEYDNVSVEQRGTNLDFIFRVYAVACEMLIKDNLRGASVRHTREHLQVLMNAYCAGTAASNSGVFLDSAIEAMKALPEAMRAVTSALHEQKVAKLVCFNKSGSLLTRKRDKNEIPPVEIVSDQTRFLGLRKSRAAWNDEAKLCELKMQGILEFLGSLKKVFDNHGMPKFNCADAEGLTFADDYCVSEGRSAGPKASSMKQVHKPPEPI